MIDVERHKNGGNLTEKYFDEQLEKIREIRLSERKFYQKILFAKVQNKMNYVVHGHIEAELLMIHD